MVSSTDIYILIYTQLNFKTVLFQTIQFNKSPLLSSIWPTHKTLSSAPSPSRSARGSDGNKGVLCIPQSSRIIEDSRSECWVS